MIPIQSVYTKHAKDKADALGISFDDIEAAIIKGRKWKEADSDKWHASMAGIDVVFQKEGDCIVVITVYEA